MGHLLTMGVVGSSSKENEFRLPLHPSHFSQINSELRNRIYIEKGYGEKFGVDEGQLRQYTAGTMSRGELFANCDVILLPKPTKDDFSSFREGQILWGWPHYVQGEPITQVNIDKKMTGIAWEAMFSWKSEDITELHTFYKNNEMAGYCSVLHSMQLQGITGHYGRKKRAAVISFGSTARGAIYALMGHGYSDITVYTQRPSHIVRDQLPSIQYRQIKRAASDGEEMVVSRADGKTVSAAKGLADYDIIVNCILQNTNKPAMFIKGDEIENLKPGTLIVDVSCDLALGFDFAKPTSFEAPTFQVGKGVTYYAVDHSPSYLWNAATYEISVALLPYVDVVMGGEDAWNKDTTIRKAIEIKNGVILNPNILSFQNRAPEYPHLKR